jgi:tetratricopeptide (TPR) repeat protein
MTSTRIKHLIASLFYSIFLAIGNTAYANQESSTRCEESFGKESSSSTIEVCRLELTRDLDPSKKIVILELLGKAYMAQNEAKMALSAWNEASQYTKPSEDNIASTENWTRFQVLIGQTLMQIKQTEQALSLFNKTLFKIEQVLGRHALAVAMVQDALGSFHALQNNASESEAAFVRARMIYEVRLGKTHPKTLETRLNHAVGMLDVGKEKEAQEILLILAEIVNSFPEYDKEPLRAEILTFLGTLQMRSDQFQEAANNYQIAYEVRQASFGTNDIRTSQSLNNLGVVLFRAGDLKRAELALSKAYIIRNDILGNQDPLTLSTQKNLQAVISAQEKPLKDSKEQIKPNK